MAKKVAKGQLTVVSLTDGKNSYLHRAWSNSADGTKDFTTQFKNGLRYIGTYTSHDEKPSTNPKDYDWTPLFDNVKFSGRNLIKYGNRAATSTKGQYGFTSHISAKSNTDKFKLEPSKTYTITAKGKGSPHGNMSVFLQKPDKWDYSQQMLWSKNELGIKSMTFTIPSNHPAGTEYSINAFDMSKQGGCILEWIVLTEGNVPVTDWFPSPEDTEYKISQIESAATNRLRHSNVAHELSIIGQSALPNMFKIENAVIENRNVKRVMKKSSNHDVWQYFGIDKAGIYRPIRVHKGQIWTLVMSVYASSAIEVGVSLIDGGGTNRNLSFGVVRFQKGWNTINVKAEVDKEFPADNNMIFFSSHSMNENDFIAFEWISLINGHSNLKQWTPAPEDLRNDLTKVSIDLKNKKVGGRNWLLDSEEPKFRNYNGSTIKYTGGYEVKSWGAKNAVKHQISGGNSNVAGVLGSGILTYLKNNTEYAHSMYVKNLGDKKFMLTANGGVPFTVEPNTEQRVVIYQNHKENLSNMQFVVQRFQKEDELDFVVWHGQIEEGNMVTDWTPAPEDMNNRFDNLKVGGRNLLPQTKTLANNSSKMGKISQDNFINGFSVVETAISDKQVSYRDTFASRTVTKLDGGEYTLSFWAKANKTANVNCYFYSPNTTTSGITDKGNKSGAVDGSIGITLTNEWQKYWIRWTQKPASKPKEVIIGRVFDASVVAYITMVKLEEGNMATDWTPAPEDFDDKIGNIKIGGRNLLRNSSEPRTVMVGSNNGSIYPKECIVMTEGQRKYWRIKRKGLDKDKKVFSIYTTLYTKDLTIPKEQLTDGVTVSFKARASQDITFNMMAVQAQPDSKVAGEDGKRIDITTEWQVFSAYIPKVTGSIIRVNAWQPVSYSDIKDMENFYLDICEYKVEEGNMVTGWSIAPEDYDDVVANLRVGARNLWVESDCDTGFITTKTGAIVSARAEHQSMKSMVLVKPKETLSLQIWNPNKIKNTTSSNRFAFFDKQGNWVANSKNITLSGEEYELHFIEVPNNCYSVRLGVIHGLDKKDQSVKIKVERGTLPTDWSPAPEDMIEADNQNIKHIAEVEETAKKISAKLAETQDGIEKKYSKLEQTSNGFKQEILSIKDVISNINNTKLNFITDSSNMFRRILLDNKVNIKVYYKTYDGELIKSENVIGYTGKQAVVKANLPEKYVLVGEPQQVVDVGERDIEVTFIVEAEIIYATGTVYYKDGNNIVKTETVTSTVGSKLDITANIPNNYRLASGEKSEKEVSVESETFSVTFKIEKIPAIITVEYIAKGTSTIVSKSEIKTSLGETVSVKAKAPKNYQITGTDTKSVSVKATTQTVQFTVEKIPATITVEYFDRQKNKVISTKDISTFMGEVVTVKAEAPLGYVMVGETTSKVTVDNIKVTHRFTIEEKKQEPAQVRIAYQVEGSGKYIFGDTINTFIGKTVEVTAKVPDGYILIGESKQTVKATKSFQDAIFKVRVKEKEKANITVKYALSKGGAAIKTDTIQSFVGDVVDVKGAAPTNYEIVGSSTVSVKVVSGGNTVEFIVRKKKAVLNIEYYSKDEYKVVFKETVETFLGDSIKVKPKAQDGYTLVSDKEVTITIHSLNQVYRFEMNKKKNAPPAIVRVLFFDLYTYRYLDDMPIIETYIGETITVKPTVPSGFKFQDETQKVVEVKNSHQDVLFNVLPDESAKKQGVIKVKHVDSATGVVFKTEEFKGEIGTKQIVAARKMNEFPEYEPVNGTQSEVLVFKETVVEHTFLYRKQSKPTASEKIIVVEYYYESTKVHTTRKTVNATIGQTVRITAEAPKGYEIKGATYKDVQILGLENKVVFTLNKVLSQMRIKYMMDGRVVGTGTFTGYEGDFVAIRGTAPDGYKIVGDSVVNMVFNSSKEVVFNVTEKPKFDTRGSYITNGEVVTELDMYKSESTQYRLNKTFQDIINSSYQDLEIVFSISGNVSSNAEFVLVSDTFAPYTKQYKKFSEIKLPDGRYGARFPFYSDYKSHRGTMLGFSVRGLGFNDSIRISNVTLKHVGRDNSETLLRPDLSLFSNQGKDGSFAKIGVMDVDDRLKKDSTMTFSLYAKPSAPYYLRLGIIDESGKETFRDTPIESKEGYIEISEMIHKKYRAVNIYLGNEKRSVANEILYKHVQAELGDKRTKWIDEGGEIKHVIERINKLEKTAEGLESVVSSKVLDGMNELKEWADSRISQTDKLINGKVSTDKSYGGFTITEHGAKLETKGMEVRLDDKKGFEIVKKSNPIKTILQVDKDGVLTFNAEGGKVTGGDSGKVDTDLYQAWADSEDGLQGFTRVKPTKNLIPSSDRLPSLMTNTVKSSSENTLVGTGFKVSPSKNYTFSIHLRNKKYGSTPTILLGVGFSYGAFGKEIARAEANKNGGRTVIKFNVTENILNEHGTYLTYKILHGVNDMELEYGKVKVETGHVDSTAFTSTAKYIGYSSKDSMNNNDYRWSLNPESISDEIEVVADNKIGLNEYQNDIEQIYKGLSDKASIENLRLIENMTRQLKESYQDFVGEGGQYSSDLAALEKRTAAIIANMGEQVARYEFITKYITMGQEGLMIGDSTSMMKILISNDKISFVDSGQEIAYMKGQEFKINRGTILESLQVGRHRMEQLDDNNTVFRYIN